ncbi:MAG: aspartate aminotransferase family protein [Deltaproteobacteria bacterium]|nr:aspartate aminotransferase family protein [Deltaproteobacteria bacterium]MCW5808549.1 aspartate aminotransferase family protein [Deltaproteobacteria bacterium]
MGAVRRSPRDDVFHRDRSFVGRFAGVRDVEVVSADGCRVVDARGRTFVDFQGGWCVGNLGWNPPEVLARVRSFDGPAYVDPDFAYAPWAELAERLVALAPGKLARAYRVATGTEAVELALQLAMVHTSRRKIVSIEGAYHGNSFAARSVGNDTLPAHLVGMKHLAPPLDGRALARLETLLKHRDVAAFIMEPTIMNLAVLIPDPELMMGLVEMCHQYGTLVIMDEVYCGFGRTGRLFACQHYGIEPDLLTLGKSLGGGVAPIAATLATERVARAVKGHVDFCSTFGWQPISVEAALATLDLWDARGADLLLNAGERSHQIRVRAAEIFDDAELRIQGLAIGIGLHGEEPLEPVETWCRDHGLLLYADGDSLVLFPPLTVDEATCIEAMDILAGAVE